jgi:polyhydroxyalkanoate synthesis regulator protein
MMKSTTAKS